MHTIFKHVGGDGFLYLFLDKGGFDMIYELIWMASTAPVCKVWLDGR